MQRIILAAVATLLPTSIVASQHPITFDELERRAARLLPHRDQLRFQDIPWVHDLAEAQRLARAEHRPIVLWGYGGRGRPDNGLEGC